MKAWIGAVALTGAVVSGGAMAVPMSYGLGPTTCGLFVTAAEESRAGATAGVHVYMTWLSGYATRASGQSSIDYFKGTDTKSVQLWLDNYCRANPLKTFNDAAESALLELQKGQAR
ncbi:hypothetical protein GNF76_25530 [Pseudomonas sp. CCM 7893]|uniref:Uncharacterized protein n=1 Tax=Pseudomonas spelaei TaxID=1055469 RepID=A0A6I3WD83_9PSED|nr:hypothetical protein [Pseudomonas spelaei]MUF07718.1 hypothetical protein [Pseudomonas spelaei]